MSRRETFCVALLLLFSSFGLAVPQVQVVGLFPGAAVILVDGQRKLVKVGQTGPGGVAVVSADGRGAVLRVEGVERRYELSRAYSDGFAAPRTVRASIARSGDGHYWSEGSIDAYPVLFLVDTGATSIAMNEARAQGLGIDYRAGGRPLAVSTASGTARAWRVSLASVRVGQIEVRHVEAVVLEGAHPREVLLGMSFLNRVGWREEQGALLLESRH